jgi:hypothetical protein
MYIYIYIVFFGFTWCFIGLREASKEVIRCKDLACQTLGSASIEKYIYIEREREREKER